MVAFYGFLVCRVFLVLNVSVFKYEDIFQKILYSNLYYATLRVGFFSIFVLKGFCGGGFWGRGGGRGQAWKLGCILQG